MGEGGVGGGAEDDADRRVFAFVGPVLASVVAVEEHLAGVGVGVGAELEVDDDEAAQAAVKEDEIDAIPDAADSEAALAADEGEVAAQLQQEGLQVVAESILQIGFRVFVFEIEELEHERIAQGLVHGEGVAGLRLRAFLEHGGFVLGKQSALVEKGADLPVELADTPAAAQGFLFVKAAGRLVFDGEELDVVRPRQREARCESLEEAEGVGGRFTRQCR